MAATVHAFAPRPSTDVRSPLQSGAVAAFRPRVGFVVERAYVVPDLIVKHETEKAILFHQARTGRDLWAPKASVRPYQGGAWAVMDWLLRSWGANVAVRAGYTGQEGR